MLGCGTAYRIEELMKLIRMLKDANSLHPTAALQAVIDALLELRSEVKKSLMT